MAGLARRDILTAAALAAAGLALSCAPSRTDTAASRTALDELARKLRGSLVRPGDKDYVALATPRNLRFAASMPQAVVLSADTQDVAEAVSWARNTGLPFAIRGGGHHYAAGSSTAGILIMTRPMNRAVIDGNTLRAQAGVRNSDLAELLPRAGAGRLLLPGGNCPGVGIAGLTLGGGIGPNAPWAGLTADRLRRATMVTADGRVVTASAGENPDLFWGLRGGAGGNFGVVTELEYELVEVPVTRATTALLRGTGRDAAVSAALAFQKVRAENERTVSGTLLLGEKAADIEFRMRVQTLSDEPSTREILAPILAVPGITA
ncbi:MAG: FAD-binding oxidoreductase, partial [Mycobacterium sp.]|nr:FAD-binding oxidoreductase [Mycobacterium sp.]